MNDLDTILFFSFAFMALASALAVTIVQRLVHAVLLLVVMMAALSALYALLGAHFLAVIQILIYAGAILVLFLLVVMLLGSESRLPERPAARFDLVSILIAGAFAAELILILLRSGARKGFSFPAAAGTVEAVGALLFKHYLLPFELVSLVLLVGIVGVVSLTQKERPAPLERGGAALGGKSKP